MEDKNYSFISSDLPSSKQNIIKVLGVGGGGSNAVNYMCSQGIHDVEFGVCNTDKQHLNNLKVATKLHIGEKVTAGLGAGSNPELGRLAAEESEEIIKDFLGNGTKMVFITAGMGGGTGTGAAPVIARIARDLDLLTVGIVTMPWSFEGLAKTDRAKAGIEEMKKYCDTVLVIINDKLLEIYGDLSASQANNKADSILLNAAKSIAEIITKPGMQNVDFRDVVSVMKDSGTAVMGSIIAPKTASASEIADLALKSPLLDNRSILGASKILVSIASGAGDNELSLSYIGAINSYIQSEASPIYKKADLKYGFFVDEALNDNVSITVIATHFDEMLDTIPLQNEGVITDNPSQDNYTAPVQARLETLETVSARPTILHNQNGSAPTAPDLFRANLNNNAGQVQTAVVSQQAPVVDINGALRMFDTDPALGIQNNVAKPIVKEAPALTTAQRMQAEKVKRTQAIMATKGMSGLDADMQKLLNDVTAYDRKKLLESSEDQPETNIKPDISRTTLDTDNNFTRNRFLNDNVD